MTFYGGYGASTFLRPPSTPILLSASGAEPLSVDEAQNWLRLDQPDDALPGLITAARDWFERATDRQLTVATYELRLGAFGQEIELPYPPVVSVAAVKYLDTLGVPQTLATTVYEVLQSRVPALIRLQFAQYWPATYPDPEAVRVTYTAGAVSELIKQGIRMLVAHWYENRGDGEGPGAKQDIPQAVNAIAWAAGSHRM